MRITEYKKANSMKKWRNFVVNFRKNQTFSLYQEKIEIENEFLRQEIKDLNDENEKLLNKIRKLEVRSASRNKKAESRT